MSCVYCQKAIDNTQAFIELSCGKHLAHSSHQKIKCVDAACCGQPMQQVAWKVDAPVIVQQQKVVVDEELRAISASRVTEPLCPPQSGGVRKMVGSVVRAVSR
jgi:hypothetical protein